MKVGDKIRSCGGRFLMLGYGPVAYKRLPFMNTKRMYCIDDDDLSFSEFEYKDNIPGSRWGPAYTFYTDLWGVAH